MGPFLVKRAAKRRIRVGTEDRSDLADRLRAGGWSNFVHEGRQRSLCRVDAIPPLIRKQMHIYPAAGPKPRTYALLTEEAKPAAFACKRRGEAPIICLAQPNGLIVPHKFLRKKIYDSGPKAVHAVDMSCTR